MDENLISKKELLALTGISYGALYRWKRKQLIPEEWFIRKNTFTGPETFFPRDNILERIAKIQEMKEELSLDDLAQTFSPVPLDMSVTGEKLIEEGLLSNAVRGLKQFSPERVLDFYGALYLTLCDKLLRDGLIGLQETETVLEHLLDGYAGFDVPPKLSIYRKMGVVISILSKDRVSVDPEARMIAEIQTGEMWERLKTRSSALKQKGLEKG